MRPEAAETGFPITVAGPCGNFTHFPFIPTGHLFAFQRTILKTYSLQYCFRLVKGKPSVPGRWLPLDHPPVEPSVHVSFFLYPGRDTLRYPLFELIEDFGGVDNFLQSCNQIFVVADLKVKPLTESSILSAIPPMFDAITGTLHASASWRTSG